MAKELTPEQRLPEALLDGYQEADQPADRFAALREEPGGPAPPVRLDGFRQLIFLDRYAQKDPERRFRPGEPVVVQVKDDPRAPEKEVGRVVTAGDGRVTVQLLQSGEVIVRPLKLVERPLETQPSQMWERMARAAAGMETNDQRTEWERAFRWALDGFRFVPAGRISTMLGTEQNLTAYNCFSGETKVLTEAGLRPIKDLSGPVPVMGHDGVIREADFGLYGVDRLWRIELENGRVIHATVNHRWPYLTAKGDVRWTTTKELAGRRLIRTTADLPCDQDDPLGVLSAAESVDDRGSTRIAQKEGEPLEIPACRLDRLGVATMPMKHHDRRNPSSGEASHYYILRIPRHTLRPQDFIRDDHRMRLMTNLPRRRRSTVRVVSVEPTDRIEPVYCCEEPETHSFVIEGGLWTGNCYVIPLQPDAGPGRNDSRRSIIDTLGRMVEIMSRGGGVGINLSTLRPQLAPVRGVNGRSSGSVSWGGLFSFATGLVEQGGSRRGALMVMIDDWHPDLLRFIRAKQTMGAITNANMSVCVSDAFMRAVQEDGEWELVFPDTSDPDYDQLWDGDLQAWREQGKPVEVHDRVRAREVWNEIVTSAWKSAEPGVVFIDRYNEYSNARYYARIACTNPCGEQGLPPFGVCNLGHVNLARFVEGQPGEARVLWEELARAVWLGVRFLDNVIDITPYFLAENEALQKGERRVGLGTMGLGEMLIRLGIRYGSDESLAFMDGLYGFIARHAYRASVAIAREKGSFPRFEAEGFLSSAFMQAMPQEIQEAVRAHGIRNVTLITQAPTGTTGSMVGTSTGIEPYYSWTYFRKGRLGRKRVVEPIVAQVLGIDPEEAERLVGLEEPLPGAFVTALELAPEEHVRVQAVAQRWCDSSISKTANLPAEYTVEQTEAIYWLAYDLGCKGVTIYRDRSRDEQVLSRT